MKTKISDVPAKTEPDDESDFDNAPTNPGVPSPLQESLERFRSAPTKREIPALRVGAYSRSFPERNIVE
jgi:hypothetical protein